jgi:hypothetical protein
MLTEDGYEQTKRLMNPLSLQEILSADDNLSRFLWNYYTGKELTAATSAIITSGSVAQMNKYT